MKSPDARFGVLRRRLVASVVLACLAAASNAIKINEESEARHRG